MIQSRKYQIVGNWKMHKTSADAIDLINGIITEVGNQNEVEVALCPPFTALESAAEVLSSIATIQLGAQNMHDQPSGAYTGEISATMLRTLYVHFVIIGHSERRQYFGETDAWINRKVLAALKSNLRPILCVGETLEQREAGHTLEVVTRQLDGALQGVPVGKADQVVVAYEPIWAIGTGKTATPQMAQEVHADIRQRLGELFRKSIAQKIRILYGGSMKPANADALLAQKDIDGGLIGGASLEAKSFGKLVSAALAASRQDTE